MCFFLVFFCTHRTKLPLSDHLGAVTPQRNCLQKRGRMAAHASHAFPTLFLYYLIFTELAHEKRIHAFPSYAGNSIDRSPTSLPCLPFPPAQKVHDDLVRHSGQPTTERAGNRLNSFSLSLKLTPWWNQPEKSLWCSISHARSW